MALEHSLVRKAGECVTLIPRWEHVVATLLEATLAQPNDDQEAARDFFASTVFVHTYVPTEGR